MKKRGVLFLKYLFAFSIAMVLCLPDDCFVMAREGLSDAELYGNGQESILYQGSSQKKLRSDSSQGKKTEYKNQQSDREVKEAAKEKTTARSNAVQGANGKEGTADGVFEQEEASANAISREGDTPEGPSMQEERITSADAFLKEEDIIITGVKPDGVYNNAVTIEISAVQSDAAYPLLAQLYKEEKAEGQDDEVEGLGNGAIGLQIGLSSVGQMVSGNTKISEEGSYKLKVWQEPDGQKELTERSKPIKQVCFVLDKTAPVINREMISSLCKHKIDIEEVCKKVVQDESKVTTSCLVNGQQLSDGVIERPGEYELVIKAEDEAGNQVQEQVQITLKDKQEMAEHGRYSRFMTPSAIVLLFGASLLIREWRKEKQEVEYGQRNKK